MNFDGDNRNNRCDCWENWKYVHIIMYLLMTLFSNVFPESRYHGKITPQYFIILCIFKAHHHKYISSFLLLYVLSDFNFNFKNILNLFFGVKKDTLYLCINNHFTFAYLSKRCSSIWHGLIILNVVYPTWHIHYSYPTWRKTYYVYWLFSKTL